MHYLKYNYKYLLIPKKPNKILKLIFIKLYNSMNNVQYFFKLKKNLLFLKIYYFFFDNYN